MPNGLSCFYSIRKTCLRVLNFAILKISKKINFVIFHFVKSSLPFPGSVQWAGELYRVLYLI